MSFSYHRIATHTSLPVEAEVYTLSTNSWRRVAVSLSGSGGPCESIIDIDVNPDLFFNGALHSIAYTRDHKFILLFDLNDEIFQEIRLQQNYLDGLSHVIFEKLDVFKGSLALILVVKEKIYSVDDDEELDDEDEDTFSLFHIWVMSDGVDESWTKKVVIMDNVSEFFGCTSSGEFLFWNR